MYVYQTPFKCDNNYDCLKQEKASIPNSFLMLCEKLLEITYSINTV